MPPPSDPNERSRDLAACEEILGYTFRDPARLDAALRHASARTTEQEGNERLEFLGDAILGLVISEHLFEQFPELPEGELTPMRSAVVSRATIGHRLQRMGVGPFVTLGKGLANRSKIPTSVNANVFEAIVAAIWQDGGYDAAREFCLRTLAPDLDAAAKKGAAQNDKSLLQQLTQRAFAQLPRYETLGTRGPDHGKSFHVMVTLGERAFPSAWGRSKKEAEQLAAGLALRDLQRELPDDPTFEHWTPPAEDSSDG